MNHGNPEVLYLWYGIGEKDRRGLEMKRFVLMLVGLCLLVTSQPQQPTRWPAFLLLQENQDYQVWDPDESILFLASELDKLEEYVPRPNIYDC